MKIGSYLRTTALATCALIATSCGRGPLHNVTNAPAGVEKALTIIKKVANQSLNDKGLKIYARDTVEIPENVATKPGDFLHKLNNEAAAKIPEKVTGTYITYIPMTIFNGKTTTMTMLPQTRYIYEDVFKNPCVKVENGVFADKKNKHLYVPVAYLGLPK